jgi:phosphate transport system protein
MRTEFHAQLERLTAELGEMCGIAAMAVQDATAAVVDADSTALVRVRSHLRRLDELNAGVDRRAFSVLALNAPVAHDLRVAMSAFSVAASADRMGALAANIAKTATRGAADATMPTLTLAIFAEMGRLAIGLAEGARVAVLGDDADEARRVQDDDTAMNELYRRLLGTVVNDKWPHGVAAASDAVLLGRFYERFADNAVEIARKVIFQASGTLPEGSEIPR